MFAHDLCHSQIEYFSPRLVDPKARRGILSSLIEKTERHAAQAPALRERYNKSSIFNLQFPDNSGFSLRYNRLVRVGLKPFLAIVVNNFKCFYFDSVLEFGFDIDYIFIKYAAE